MRPGPAILALITILATGLGAGHAWGQTVQPPYDANYTFTDLGRVPSLPSPAGGLTIRAANPNTLLIGGGANGGSGAIYAIGITRDGANHITSFSGSATLFATAAFIDGGLLEGPGGILFTTTYSNNLLLQYQPGSVAPDKTIDLTTLGVLPSTGGITFVPPGFPGAGQMKIFSYNSYHWYSAAFAANGGGTYDVTSVTDAATIRGGPEGAFYVPSGSPHFSDFSTVLVSEYQSGLVAAYAIDANGDPVPASRAVFLSGLSGAEGAAIDPLTNDFLFSTFGGGDRVLVVRGFGAPTPICGDGVVAGNEACDQGEANGTTTSCCDSECMLVAAATVCRPAAGACDVAEACDGSSPTCPADVPPPNDPTCAGILRNGNFAQGLNYWTSVTTNAVNGFPHFNLFATASCVPAAADYVALDVPFGADGYIEQTVQLPPAPAVLALTAWGSLDPTTATVSLIDQNGIEHVLDVFTPPATQALNPDGSCCQCSGAAPVRKTYPLAMFTGQSVAVRLRSTAGGNNGTFANFDDVSIDVETSSTTTTITTTTSTTTTTMPLPCASTTECDDHDLCNGTETCQTSLCAAPERATCTPAGEVAYVTSYGDDTVQVIDVTTRTTLATLPTGHRPWGVAWQPDGRYVYVTNRRSDSVTVIDAATRTVVATIAVGHEPLGVAIAPRTERAYVANYADDTVTVIDTATATAVGTIAVGNGPTGVTVHPLGTWLYVTNYLSNTVSVIDPATRRTRARISVDRQPFQATVHPDGSKVYVTSYVSDVVSVIGTASHTVIARVPVGHSPAGLAFTRDGQRALVVNSGDDTVSLIDALTDRVVTTQPLAGGPLSAAAAANEIWVTRPGANTVDTLATVDATTTGSTAVGAEPAAFGQFIGTPPDDCPLQPLECNDHDPFTDDACDATAGCRHANLAGLDAAAAGVAELSTLTAALGTPGDGPGRRLRAAIELLQQAVQSSSTPARRVAVAHRLTRIIHLLEQQGGGRVSRLLDVARAARRHLRG